MRTLFLALVAVAAVGCTENVIVVDEEPEYVPVPASIQGRVCDPSGRTWLADALAYTNITDDSGKIVDIRKAYSDRDGYWLLDELPPNQEYTIFVQYGSDILMEEVLYVTDDEHIELDEPECFDPLALDIAIVTGDYDDVQLVLESMGFSNYTLIDGTDAQTLLTFLSDVENLRQYDVVFFNGGHVEDGVIYDRNPDNTVDDAIRANLDTYVQEGGSVYASDWSYDVVEQTWPDYIDFLGDDEEPDAAQLGDYAMVTASVTDESLSSFLGKTQLEVEYDLPVWPPVTTVEPYVSIHITGTVEYREGQNSYTLASVPLLVSFSAGSGRVAYSTFRVAANNNDDMILTLQYMMHDISE